jgi:hypothetical protein
MTAPERFADSQIPLAPRAPSIHDPLWPPRLIPFGFDVRLANDAAVVVILLAGKEAKSAPHIAPG